MRALIVDAGALYGAADANDPDHAAIVATLEEWPGELVVSAFTAAEADHLVLSRLGVDAELALLDDLAVTYTVQMLDARGLKTARKLCARYRDLKLGLADASMVVLADQWSTRSLATFDHRHFRTVTALDGEPFTLLPADGG
ncbi:MAG TPA: PIN domain-containing protein [Conexibacter sp.]|nr:PIN domain-containing protein [Conexibacter sp.]